MACALAASLIVHAAILVATLPGGTSGVAPGTSIELRATLVPTPARERSPEQPARVPPVLAALADRSPVTVPASDRLPLASPRASPATPLQGLGKAEVAAALVTDRTLLGGYAARQMNMFPAEVDRPARPGQKIVARYPEAALAQGREEEVVVWAIVEESGTVEEVYVTQGSEEFAAEVTAAVRAARFIPAEDNLKPIRYPIALQFDFRPGGGTAAAAASRTK
ncbi:MAG: TonB family protein [Burkholderiales bacterium]